VIQTSVLLRLLAIFAVIAIGWLAGRTRIVGKDAAPTLTRATFVIFTPALLFRTTAAVSLAHLPWITLAAYYLPTVGLMLLTYVWQRARRPAGTAAPAVRALSLSFSNTVQLGIPVVTAIYGTAGLAIHITIVSLQSLILLTIATVLVETGGRRTARESSALRTLGRVVFHPVVFPVLLGLLFNASGARIPGPVDDILATLSQAVIPLSLVSIGLSLNHYGIAGHVRQAITIAAGKLILQPAAVLAVGYWVFGLRGLALTVTVLCASLPIGSNVLLFASRYEELMAETTAAIVASTCAWAITGAVWIALLAHLAGPL
jgi:predicted permease